MLGFEGNPRTEAALRAALERLDEVFPEHPEPGEVEPFAITYPEDEIRPKQTDLVVRKHKHERLAMPLDALAVGWQSDEDVFIRYSLRRFAFFVPAMLADWVSPAGTWSTDRIASLAVEARRREAVRRKTDPRALTAAELDALQAFFEASLDASLHTSPLARPAPRELTHRRARPEAVLELASTFLLPPGPLLGRWLADDHPLAVEHLVRLGELDDEHVFSTPLRAPPWDAELRGRVADHLGALFFSAEDPAVADRLSAAEKAVRAILY